jgi:hypothetical protein
MINKFENKSKFGFREIILLVEDRPEKKIEKDTSPAHATFFTRGIFLNTGVYKPVYMMAK